MCARHAGYRESDRIPLWIGVGSESVFPNIFKMPEIVAAQPEAVCLQPLKFVLNANLLRDLQAQDEILDRTIPVLFFIELDSPSRRRIHTGILQWARHARRTRL